MTFCKLTGTSLGKDNNGASTGICQRLQGEEGQEAGCLTSCWMDQHVMLKDTQAGERPISNYPSLEATM